MTDINGVEIKDGVHLKYSYNDFRIPVFTGTAVLKEDGFHILHSNKVTVKIDDTIKYLEILKLDR